MFTAFFRFISICSSSKTGALVMEITDEINIRMKNRVNVNPHVGLSLPEAVRIPDIIEPSILVTIKPLDKGAGRVIITSF